LEAATLVSTAGDHTLHAQWARNSFTVTFDGNGGGAPSPEAKAVTYGALYGPLATVSRPGYTFSGWYTTSGAVGGAEVTSGTIVATAADHVLYARWTENSTYTVKYDMNGGTPATIADRTGVKWTDAGLLPANDPTRAGYAFAGWQVTAGGSDTGDKGSVGPGDTYGSLAKNDKTGAITLTARWKARGYKLSFDKNAADTSAPSKTDMSVTYGAPYGELATVARTGYAFAGWYTTSAATGGTEVTSGTTVTTPGDHTLYARWAANTYVVTFNKGDTGEAEVTLPNPVTFPVVYGGGYGTAVDAVASRTGYFFTGWWSRATGGTVVTSAAIVKTAADHKLYARWSNKSVLVNYYRNHDGGDATLLASKPAMFDGTLPTYAAPTRAGYDFDGWTTVRGAHGQPYKPGETVVRTEGPLDLYAHWSAKTGTAYTVRHYLVSDGGAASLKLEETKRGTTDTKAVAIAKAFTGYTYAPGYAKGDGKEVAGGNISGDGGLVLSLYYLINKNGIEYRVTGNMPAGAPAAPATEGGVPYGAARKVAAGRTLAGYGFSGWTTSDVQVGADGGFRMPDGGVTFTGYWTPRTDTPYRVEHYLLAADGSAVLESSSESRGITDMTVNVDALGLAGTYAGYRHDPAHAQSILSGVVKGDGSLVIKLHYALKNYLVTYDTNGGLGRIKVRMATWFDKGLLPAKNPKRSGYKLTGWKCGSRTVTKATVFSALAKNDGVAGVTLTAQWKKTADNDGDGKKKNKKNKDGGGGNSGNNGNGNGGAGDAMGGEGNDAGAADGGVNIADGAPGGAENETTVIANDDNAPTVNIGGEDVPLIGKEDVSFLGLLNIVCLIIMLAVMVRSLTRYASARRRGEKLRATYSRDDGWGVRVRSRWLTPEVILAAIGAVLFFFTDDLSGKMSLTDAYTPMQAAFMTGVIVLHRLASRDMEQALAKESSV
jgi:uncharacterized repeat protein (TIGR02543 family)